MTAKMLQLVIALAAATVASATFVIKDDSFEGLSSKPVLLKVLENTETGESAEIIFSHGGRIEQVGRNGVDARPRPALR